MNNWETLIGTLCFNIWNNTKQDFEKSGDFVDMEWPFLSALYIFHHWDNSNLSKRYSIPKLIPEVDPSLIQLKDTFLSVLPIMKDKIDHITQSRKMNSQMTVEPSKIFITLFTDDFINMMKGSFGKMNPIDFFQVGVELLLLVTLEIKERDKAFYNLTSDIGKWETEDANSILDQINKALET
ncbi:MAG: hypothetical protein ABSD71_02305 [Bacteroidales bacterium]|jgi:hypothetical protein